MRNFVLGFLVGIVVATIGVTGIARLLDRGVEVVKSSAQELAQ